MRRLALLLPLATVLWGCEDSAPAPVAPPGPPAVTSGGSVLLIEEGGRVLRLTRGGRTLLTFGAGAFALGTVPALSDDLSYDPYWLELSDDLFSPSPPEGLAWRLPRTVALVGSGPEEAQLFLDYGGGLTALLSLSAEGEDRIRASLVPALPAGGPAIAWIRLSPRASATEGFYGLGEWPDAVNHRGKLRAMQLELDPHLESANNEAHVPVPFLTGTSGFGLFVESRRPGLFDVARKADDLVEVTYGTAEESAQGLTFHLFTADEPLTMPRHYWAVTGAPLLPAPWALGPWIWRNENRNQAEFEDDVRTLRALDLATSAIWIDRPYATGVNTFDFDPAKFQDPDAMIATAHAAGLRVALWHTPYLAEDAEPLRSEALAAGYFPPESGVLLNHWSPPLDLTNPAAYAFWQEKVRLYTARGIEGFKLDFAEDVIPGIGGGRNRFRFADGSTERTMHHGYTLLYHQVYAETLPADGGFLLCRAGKWGDQVRASVIWPGDMDASFTRHGEVITDPDGTTKNGVGGLPATVIQGIGLGASGFPFFGADTGGYLHSPPDRELYIRWFQQTALSTVMQVGDSSSQPPWVFTAENGRDDAVVDLYRLYARLHLRLFPYEWALAQRLAAEGRPLQRAVGLAYPALGVHPDDEYLLGDDLLVAPVVERGATSREVLFPPGRWYDFFDGTMQDGGAAGATATVAAPLTKLPLFLREGAIVPLLRPTIDTLSPATDPGVESYADEPGLLFVRLAPGGVARTFLLHDGSSISAGGDGPIGLVSGSTFREGFVLELVARGDAVTVELDGVAAPRVAPEELPGAAGAAFAFDPAAIGGTLLVRVPPTVRRVVVR